jgi:uncharacterized protein YnzC (UPF0291/DUF896 family)
MLEKEKMVRINALARKAKQVGLSIAEKEEQHQLRQEYLAKFRQSFRNQLENIEIVDGNVPIEQK